VVETHHPDPQSELPTLGLPTLGLPTLGAPSPAVRLVLADLRPALLGIRYR